MEHTKRENHETVIKESLQQRFQLEREKSLATEYYGRKREEPVFPPYPDDDYLAECSVLPNGFLDGINADKWLSDDFMLYVINGFKCCASVLPFADNCSDKASLVDGARWEKFLADKDFFRLIVSNSRGMGSRFENDSPGFWQKLLPDVLAKDVAEGGATFMINYPHRLIPGGLTKDQVAENRTWLVSQIETALNNLRVFFNKHRGTATDEKSN